MFTAQGLGRRKNTFSHTHTVRSTINSVHTHACMHAHTLTITIKTSRKENIQAAVKEAHL